MSVPSHTEHQPHQLRRWRPAIFASAVLVAVVAVAFGAGGDGSSGTASTTTATTTATTAAPPLMRTLKAGLHGEDVRRLQQRLKDLAFDPNFVDGDFGYNTKQAVWAFEKLVMKTPRRQAKGEVTPEMWQLMQRDDLVVPRRANVSTPSHVEIYLPEQVLIVFAGAKPVLVTHISTGTGEEWCEEVTIDPGEQGNVNGKEPIKEGVCGIATTPGGFYYFYNRKSGVRQSKLGTMWNPVYFNGGIAIHGAAQVPNSPASHGCVRIPMHVSEYFQTLVAYGDRVFVFDGVKEPEAYGAPAQQADKLDPNYTTTTTTVTTTTVTTTTVTTTTVPVTLTTVPKVPKSSTTLSAVTTTLVSPTTVAS